ELLGYLILVRRSRGSLREAGADRLLDPDHTTRVYQLSNSLLRRFSLGEANVDCSTTITGELLQEERGPILGQIDPGVRVLHRGKSTILPKEGSVLLQETFERTTTGATIEPDGDLIASKGVR
ncbi:MAG: hypothetical protein LQ345_003651, partial [Seirophora villosa]